MLNMYGKKRQWQNLTAGYLVCADMCGYLACADTLYIIYCSEKLLPP